MKRAKKPAFFIVAISIIVFTVFTIIGFSSQYGDIKTTYIKGVDDIRWGIDIKGGVDVTFTPPKGVDATKAQMDAVKEVIQQRLINKNITDYELYVDYNKDRVIVRYPWQAGEEDFDPETAVKELGETALLTFREGKEVDEEGLPSGVTKENIILEGKDVSKAQALYDSQNSKYIISLELASSGKDKFSEATKKLATTKGVISIWMDNEMISYPTVNSHISDGKATIEGSFTAEEATALANKINSGALPFKLETNNFSAISPTLGEGARDSMVLAGIIGFILVAIFMIFYYRLPGFVAVIALVGQVAGMIACVSGFFGFMDSFTLTIPGIAGIILSIGMGVDANVITNERIIEELNKGKTLDSAISQGFSKGFTAIFDGNITVVIVAVILMGAFGPTDSIFAKLLYPVLFMFGPSTAGAIYSFGYTLLVGVVLNFVFAVTCSRLMLSGISKFKGLRNPKLYGGKVNNEE